MVAWQRLTSLGAAWWSRGRESSFHTEDEALRAGTLVHDTFVGSTSVAEDAAEPSDLLLPKEPRGFESCSRSLRCETHHSRLAGSPRRACLPAFGLDERHQQLKRLRSKHVRWHRSGGHTLRATVNRDTEPSPWLEASSGWIERQRVRTSHREIRSSRQASLSRGEPARSGAIRRGSSTRVERPFVQRASTCSSRLQRSRSQTAAMLGGARHLVRARPRERRATQAAKADTFPPELPSARLQSDSRSPHS